MAMSTLLAFGLLCLQPDPALEVRRLASDRIEDREGAAAAIKASGRAFRDAARLWLQAAASADEPSRARLRRIGSAWRQALAGAVVIEPPPPDDAAPAAVDLGEEDLRVAVKLATTRLTLHVVNASLLEVLDYCSHRSGIRIRILGIRDPDHMTLNFEVRDEPLDALLSNVLRPHRLYLTIRYGRLLVGPAESVQAPTRMQVYSVADITRNFPGDALVLQILGDVNTAD